MTTSTFYQRNSFNSDFSRKMGNYFLFKLKIRCRPLSDVVQSHVRLKSCPISWESNFINYDNIFSLEIAHYVRTIITYCNYYNFLNMLFCDDFCINFARKRSTILPNNAITNLFQCRKSDMFQRLSNSL